MQAHPADALELDESLAAGLPPASMGVGVGDAAWWRPADNAAARAERAWLRVRHRYLHGPATRRLELRAGMLAAHDALCEARGETTDLRERWRRLTR